MQLIASELAHYGIFWKKLLQKGLIFSRGIYSELLPRIWKLLFFRKHANRACLINFCLEMAPVFLTFHNASFKASFLNFSNSFVIFIANKSKEILLDDTYFVCFSVSRFFVNLWQLKLKIGFIKVAGPTFSDHRCLTIQLNNHNN